MTQTSDRSTAKHDDDPILDFQNIPTDKTEGKKVKIAGIEILDADQNELIAYTGKKIEKNYASQLKYGPLHIQPIDPYIFHLIRHSKLYTKVTSEAFVNLASARGMRWISRLFGKPISHINPAPQFVMNLIRYAQAKDFTIFIIGSDNAVLEKLSANLMRSFPRLRITGKHPAYRDNADNEKVISALKKTNPHIILVSMGFKKEMRWINQNRGELKNCILINLNGTLDIMTGRRKRAPDFIEEAYMTWLWECFNRPYRWHRLILLLYGTIEMIFLKIFRRKQRD